MFRLLLWILLLPFRILRWAGLKLYLLLRGYDVVRLRLHGALPDRHAGGLLAALSPEARGPTLLDALLVLDRARRDPRVRAIVVEVESLHCGLGRAEELGAALAAARDAGKEVWVHLEDAGLVEYRVALGGSRIVLAPPGGVRITGVASEVTLLRGLLDKVGVRAWLSARGKYKSARETFAEEAMSDANREMTESLVGDLFDQLVEAIAASRRLEAEVVRAHLDAGPFRAEEALARGLVDAVGYADALEKQLEQLFGKVRPVEPRPYLALSAGVAGRGKPTVVAVVEVGGHIKGGRSVPGPDGPRATGSRSFVKEIERIAQDPHVKALLLRVDSPGGSAVASDLMWRALVRLREKKPLVVSMVDVAASGGYYVAGVKGATVLASASTLTGSIGVLGGKLEARGLYDKLGIRKEIVGRGARAGYYSDYRGFTEDELARLESEMDGFYEDFVRKMAEGRGRTFEELHAVAQGRVWTGRQALERGLVDAQGGLLAALAAVRGALGLRETAPLALAGSPPERARFPLRLAWDLPQDLVPGWLEGMLRLSRDLHRERLLAMLPFRITFR